MRKRKTLSDVRVVALGHKGLCIGKTKEGEAVLVKGAVPGDLIDLQVRKRRNKMKWGVPERFIEKSPHRVSPVCQHFEHCGGCSWQNLNYPEQLNQKSDIVENAVRRIGQIKEGKMLPILGADQPYWYRNKMVFSFSKKRWMTPEEIRSEIQITEPGLGFYAGGTFDKVINIFECHLQADPSNDIRNFTRGWALDGGYTFYDAKNHVGELRNLIVRTARSGEVMVTLVTGSDRQDLIDDFTQKITDAFDQISSVVRMVNTKWNDSLHDIDFEVQVGPGYITETLDGVDYRIGPKSFFQTNPDQAEVLFRSVREVAEPKESQTLYDLYCGVGTIGLYLSRYVKKVVGVEEIAEAIEDARINAQINDIKNAEFEVGDVKLLMNEKFIQRHGQADIIVTDPPRAGMHEDVVNVLNRQPVSTVVYISCNPATQARDLSRLSERYEVVSVRPVDMFPQTNHVESIALLKERQ